MIYTGRHAPPLLMAPFACWVVAPFAALAIADALSTRWPVVTRSALYVVMLVLTVASLAIYGYMAFGPLRRTTFAFVVVPPVSCLLLVVVVATAALVSRVSEKNSPSATFRAGEDRNRR